MPFGKRVFVDDPDRDTQPLSFQVSRV